MSEVSQVQVMHNAFGLTEVVQFENCIRRLSSRRLLTLRVRIDNVDSHSSLCSSVSLLCVLLEYRVLSRGDQMEFSRTSRLRIRIRRSFAVRELLRSSRSSRRVFGHSLCFFVSSLFS